MNVYQRAARVVIARSFQTAIAWPMRTESVDNRGKAKMCFVRFHSCPILFSPEIWRRLQHVLLHFLLYYVQISSCARMASFFIRAHTRGLLFRQTRRSEFFPLQKWISRTMYEYVFVNELLFTEKVYNKSAANVLYVSIHQSCCSYMYVVLCNVAWLHLSAKCIRVQTFAKKDDNGPQIGRNNRTRKQHPAQLIYLIILTWYTGSPVCGYNYNWLCSLQCLMRQQNLTQPTYIGTCHE